ncbi:Hypothetical predicted protein [Xyrichtys novacula]|uniref:Uncharacterized protein n=1 Tax=Xyrichtys novacula TaxID=13765 RepID=A0AAV1H058_XYRNO|nr:Hypothetical predicted protein [Xyrichtys novacula]
MQTLDLSRGMSIDLHLDPTLHFQSGRWIDQTTPCNNSTRIHTSKLFIISISLECIYKTRGSGQNQSVHRGCGPPSCPDVPTHKSFKILHKILQKKLCSLQISEWKSFAHSQGG